MSQADFGSPREAARAFTPKLSAFVDDTLNPCVWSDPTLSLRDRSLVTVAALIAGGHLDELPSHLRRAVTNGVTHALTQDICYPTVVVASCNLLPVRMQAGATYDE
ncbi:MULTISPECIES: carboxymuconolactone decarboxylase family protein, partial [Burkholderia]